MGGKFTSAYAMKATLLQIATMRRLTMSFMPKAANTKAEATNPIAVLFVAIAANPLCVMTALCVMTVVTIAPSHQWTEMVNGPKIVGGALSLALRSPSGRHRGRHRADVRTYRKSQTLFELAR
jgi:hypothetical protein